MNKLFLLLAMSLISHPYGQNLLKNGDFEQGESPWIYYQEAGSGADGTFSIVTSDTHSGSKCAQVKMTGAGANIWDAQVSQSGFSVNQSTIYKLSFYARGVSGASKIQCGFVKNSEPYTWYGGQTFSISSSWQKFEYTFACPVTTVTDIQLVFQFAKNIGTYFVDDAVMEKSGNMATVPDDWYQKADERIEQIRKGNFTIKVLRGTVPVPSCSVRVEMKRSEFKWGTCVSLENNITETEKWYRATAAEYFNYGVFENAFKWQSMEPGQGNILYSDVDRYLKWADSLGWQMRGHTLVWGGDKWLPSWIKNLSTQDKIAAVKTRITRDVGHYKGKIAEYDVVNEPIHETYLADQVGESIHTLAFKWAHEADPSARLYINDYNIISGSDALQFRALIEKMIKDGAPIDGIGLQGHFGLRVDWKQVAGRLNYMAEIGLPIKITEFDLNVKQIGMDQLQMAQDCATMMRVAFSHPAVTAFLFWGFWDGRHWLPSAGLFDNARNKKIAADSVYNLIHDTWTTKKNLKTGSDGKSSFKGFYGTYNVQVYTDGEWKKFSADFFKGSANSIDVDISSGTVATGNFTNAEILSNYPITSRSGSVKICDIRGRVVAKLSISDYHNTFGRQSQKQSAPLKLTPGTYYIMVGEKTAHIPARTIVIR